jgi:hypothetical protein
MYINKIKNYVIKIKDEDLFLLLERYNLDNFEVLEAVNGEKVYKNRTKCPFCEKYYKSNCMGCPFKHLETDMYGEIVFGCENALRLLMDGVDLDDIHYTADEVVFYESNGNRIVESIQSIYDFFSSFKHI